MVAWLIPIEQIPPGCLSFTLGDSLVCRHPEHLAFARARGRYQHPQAGGLVLRGELDGLSSSELELIEAQIWFQPDPAALDRSEITP